MDLQNFNIWFILYFLDLLMEFLGFFILESHFWNWFKNMFCNRYFNLIYLFLGMIGRNLYINILYVFYLIFFLYLIPRFIYLLFHTGWPFTTYLLTICVPIFKILKTIKKKKKKIHTYVIKREKNNKKRERVALLEQ